MLPCLPDHKLERWNPAPEDGSVNEAVLHRPLRWRKPRCVWVQTRCDLFGPCVDDAARDRLFAIMALARRHTFLVCTEQPEQMRRYVTEWNDRPGRFESVIGSTSATDSGVTAWCESHGVTRAERDRRMVALHYDTRGVFSPAAMPLPHVWLGARASGYDGLWLAVDPLLDSPAARRFLVLEPLSSYWTRLNRLNSGRDCLWHVDALRGQIHSYGRNEPALARSLDWVIVGGDMRADGIRCDLTDLRAVLSDCRDAGVPAYVTQLGRRVLDQPRETCVQRRTRKKTSITVDCETCGRVARFWAIVTPHDYFLALADADKEWQDHIRELPLQDVYGADIDEWPEDVWVRQFPGVVPQEGGES